MITTVRADVGCPIVLFSYTNPMVRMGLDRFAERACAAGVDGVLAIDLPIEEAGHMQRALAARGIDMIFLVSPTSTDARIGMAAALGRGFLYAIARLGVTGPQESLDAGVEALVRRIRAVSDLPLAVGFGISRPEHVATVTRWADAAVVGSALVQVIADAADAPDLLQQVTVVRAVAEGRGMSNADADAPRGVQERNARARLDTLRSAIDALDEQLLRLLNERSACALEIGRVKRDLHMDVYQPQREADVLAHVRSANAGPLPAESVARVFERIIDEARRLERLAQGNGDGDA